MTQQADARVDPRIDAEAAVRSGDREMTIGEHLLELRRRLTITVLTVVLTTVLALVFAQEILDYLIEPGRRADPDFRPIFTELLAYVGVYVKVSLLAGIALAMPVMTYQLFMFVNPALTRQERKWILPIVLFATIAFAGGAAFSFFIAWPPALDFLLNFGDSVAQPQIRINNYIDLLTRFMFWSGIIFETPLVMMGLGYLGLVNHKRLIRSWRWAVIGSFVVSAVVTPSVDPVTQTAVALPLMLLYALGVGLVRLVEKRGIASGR